MLSFFTPQVSLKWPTALAINPLDDSLHILDGSIVLKLTSDFKLVTVAGRPVYCPLRHTSFLPQVRLHTQRVYIK